MNFIEKIIQQHQGLNTIHFNAFGEKYVANVSEDGASATVTKEGKLIACLVWTQRLLDTKTFIPFRTPEANKLLDLHICAEKGCNEILPRNLYVCPSHLEDDFVFIGDYYDEY